MVIDNLEKRGLVSRVRSKNDRRYSNIELTKMGDELIRRMFPRHVKAIVDEFSVLTGQEQEILRNLCRKLGRGGESVQKER